MTAFATIPTVRPSDDKLVALRVGLVDDAPEVGPILFRAFENIAQQHRFPPDFPSAEAGTALAAEILARRDVYSVVAERDGRVVGSNFLWEQDSIAGVGPITVDPAVQNDAVGRSLMRAVLSRAEKRKFAGVRLVQAAYHNRSLALYSKLGFDAREPLSVVTGSSAGTRVAGRAVRAVRPEDLSECNALAARLLGCNRANELRRAAERGLAMLVESDGRITGYTTGIGFFGHSVGESNVDVQALIAAAPAISGPGLLVPTRNAMLLRWCLANGFRIVQPMTLMSVGAYDEPKGAYLPSVLY